VITQVSGARNSTGFVTSREITQAFTITGNLQGVATVTVTRVNRTGSSNVMTVTF
jgi:hypothetical protein